MIGAPKLIRPVIGVNETVDFEVDVTNTGRRPGDEVVQIYLHDEEASVTRPVLELKRFARVSLEPGERRTLPFDLKPRSGDLERADEAGGGARHVHDLFRTGLRHPQEW